MRVHIYMASHQRVKRILVINTYFLAVLEISVCRVYGNTCNRDSMLLVASQLHVLQQGARVRRGHASKLCIRRYHAK